MTTANDELRQYLANGDATLLDGELLREAAASVRLDRDDRGGTHVVEGAEVQPTEKQIQDAIEQALLLDGYMVIRINSGAMKVDGRYIQFCRWTVRGMDPSAEGVADLLAIRGDKIALIETKDYKGQQRPSQIRFEQACDIVGAEYVIARSVDDVAHLLERVEA